MSTSASPQSTPSSAATTTPHLDINTAPDPKTSLTLSPRQGPPGTQVTITAAGYGLCTEPTGVPTRELPVGLVFSLQWDGMSVDRSHASTGRDVVVPYTVPADAPARDYLVTASCGDVHDSTTFTVVAPTKAPSLELDTQTGHRGSEVTASGTDFACGSSESVQLFWDGQSDPLAEAPPQAFRVTLTVPAETAIGGHTVVAQCQYHSTITASQSFEVTKADPPAVPPPPSLAIQPTSGRPGDQMRIAGERFACVNGTVELSWDGTQLADTPVDMSGHFETSVAVPANADARDHTVHVACADGSDAMATTFTVVTEGSPPPPVSQPAAMALRPVSGQRGDQMRIAGERFACANGTVELSWDDATRLADTPVDTSGGFATTVPVPANADIRSHTVGAACSDGPIALTAAFTVIAGTTLPPAPQHTGIWGWVIALVLVVAAVLVVRHIRQRRHSRLDTRVHVVARASGLPLTTVHETPAHGEATHAIRLEAHFDSGTQTIREVNDDHTHA